MANTILVYNTTLKRFQNINKNRCRTTPRAPEGTLRVYRSARLAEHSNNEAWQYMYYGDTQRAICLLVNRFDNQRIDELQQDIDKIRSQLIIPENTNG